LNQEGYFDAIRRSEVDFGSPSAIESPFEYFQEEYQRDLTQDYCPEGKFAEDS
jgi:hypothetical protein